VFLWAYEDTGEENPFVWAAGPTVDPYEWNRTDDRLDVCLLNAVLFDACFSVESTWREPELGFSWDLVSEGRLCGPVEPWIWIPATSGVRHLLGEELILQLVGDEVVWVATATAAAFEKAGLREPPRRAW
jgi:hypothetical protein